MSAAAAAAVLGRDSLSGGSDDDDAGLFAASSRARGSYGGPAAGASGGGGGGLRLALSDDVKLLLLGSNLSYLRERLVGSLTQRFLLVLTGVGRSGLAACVLACACLRACLHARRGCVLLTRDAARCCCRMLHVLCACSRLQARLPQSWSAARAPSSRWRRAWTAPSRCGCMHAGLGAGALLARGLSLAQMHARRRPHAHGQPHPAITRP